MDVVDWKVVKRDLLNRDWLNWEVVNQDIGNQYNIHGLSL